MAASMIELCEQSNPVVLAEARKAGTFRNAHRIQGGFLAGMEKRVLLWMAQRMPAWVSPDKLTVLGFTAQIGAGVCYALSGWEPKFLLLGILCLAVNWFGDSLDGTLARVRQQQRPRYGFYVDHMIDSFGSLALMGGLAVSGFMHPAIAIGLLVGFLMLSIQSYLATYTMGEFHLSFWRLGPTELRVLLATGNIALLRYPMVIHGQYRLFDVGGAIGLVGMAVMLITVTVRNTARLYREERIR